MAADEIGLTTFHVDRVLERVKTDRLIEKCGRDLPAKSATQMLYVREFGPRLRLRAETANE
jgi:hypothetical protein